MYYPDFEESVDIVKQFDKELKYVTFKINHYNELQQIFDNPPANGSLDCK